MNLWHVDVQTHKFSYKRAYKVCIEDVVHCDWVAPSRLYPMAHALARPCVATTLAIGSR